MASDTMLGSGRSRLHICHHAIDEIIKSNDRHLLFYRDGVALWVQRSVAYQPCPDLRLFQNGHRASRDLMEWEGLRLHILHLFHRAGACLNPYSRCFPSLDVSSQPGLFAFSTGFFAPSQRALLFLIVHHLTLVQQRLPRSWLRFK